MDKVTCPKHVTDHLKNVENMLSVFLGKMQCSHAVPIFGKLTEFHQNREKRTECTVFTEFARFRVKTPIFCYFSYDFVYFFDFLNVVLNFLNPIAIFIGKID